MKTYRYVAVNTMGQVIRGEQTANSQDDLQARLARLSLELISAKVPRKALSQRPRSLPLRDLINVLIHLQTLSQAGVPLIESLTDLRDSSDAQGVRSFVADLVDRIEAGSTLSQAMAQSPWPVDDVIVSLVQTGEATGKLPEVLHEIIENLKWTDEITEQTKKLLRAPAFTGAVVLGAIAFLMVYLVPQLLVFIKGIGGDIPFQTVLLIRTSEALQSHGYLLVAVPFLLWLLARAAARASPAWRERLDGWKLRAPPIGPILKKIIMARFANSFALMYRSGVSVIDALGFCKGLSTNFAYQKALDNALKSITEGQKISDAFAQLTLFPPLVIRMLRVGENTGGLDTALDNVSYFYRREVNDSVEKLQAAIQPALTVFLGGMVAWIMSSVLLPIYDVISKVKF
ncbi:MAG: type II secretion system F family protein [Ramlibacter sp.]|nr:type II secretion system F family protein [Ramlibacter sp.]